MSIKDVQRNNSWDVVSDKEPDDFPSTSLKNVFLKLENNEPYDESEINAACTFVNNRWDCSDFRTITLLRFMYTDEYALSNRSRDVIKETLLNFKYWLNDGGDDSMTYWSENHQILFATSELLAGQLFPDEIFTQTGLTGAQHTERAKKRVLIWLNQRWNYGFTEWYSNQYYVEDIAALANLIDFSDDEEIVQKSKIIMDLLIYDIASQSYYGNFMATSGRAYEKNRKSGDKGNSLRAVVDSIWDYELNKDDRLGLEMNFLAMKNYSVPEVLYLIGEDHDESIIKASSGLKLSELKELGFQGVNDETIMMQLGMEAFTNPEVVNNTLDIISEYKMFTNYSLKDFADIDFTILRKAKIIPPIIKIINPQTNGIAIQKADTYTYKNNNFMLTTAMNYFPGNFGDQHNVQTATLSSDISVYNTHPAVSENKSGLNGNSPTYWTGYGYLPDAVQDKNIAMSIYRLPKKSGLLQSPVLQYTYSWFPTDKFDEWKIEDNKAFGLKKDAYIALIAKNPINLIGDEKDRLQQDGQDTYWITELGSKSDYDSLDDFIDTINSRKITWNDGYLKYETLDKVIELKYDDYFKVNGVIQNTNYDRYDSPYVHAIRSDKEIIFNWMGESLKLDFDNNIREASGDFIKIK
ncbi:MAG: hypothetical protein ACRQFF_03285 [Sphaerochaeta sp.]